MGIIVRHIWRNIRENSIRSALIILSLALASAVFYLCLNIRDDVYDSSVTLLEGVYKGYDIGLSGDAFAEGSVELPENERVFAVNVRPGVTDGFSAIIAEMDCARAVSEGLVQLSEGGAEYSGGAILSRTKALYNKISVGDELSVLTPDGEEKYTVAALADSLGIFSAGGREALEILVPRASGEATVVYAALSGGADAEGAVSELAEKYPEMNAFVLGDAGADAEKQLKSISRILLVILFVMIAIAFYVISSITNLILAARLPVMGTFRSVGATRARTNLILIFENILYGLLGSAVGLLAGEGLRSLLSEGWLSGSRGGVSALYILLVPAFSVVLQTAISLFAILRLSSVGVKELIFRTPASAARLPLKKCLVGAGLMLCAAALMFFNKSRDFLLSAVVLLLAVAGAGMAAPLAAAGVSAVLRPVYRLLFGPSAWLGAKNLRVSKINRSSVVLVTIVTALTFVIYLCVSSVGAFFESYGDNYPYDIFIKGASQDAAEYEFLSDVEGVDSLRAEFWDYRTVRLNGDEEKLCFVSRSGFSNGVETEDGALAALSDGETLADRMFASTRGIKVGDVLTISQDGGSFSLTVAGFCDSAVFNAKRTTLVLTENDFFSRVETSPALLGVDVTGDISDMTAALSDAIAEKTGEAVSVWSKEAYITKEMDAARQALALMGAVPVLAAALAVLGLVNNQLISFSQKKKEYAVLYSVAMSRAQLKKMVFSELLDAFFSGCLCGAALSLWLVRVVRDIIYSTIAYVNVSVSWALLPCVFALALALMCLTGLAPARRFSRINVVREIKYE